MSWHHRLANFLRPARLGRDIDREVRFHVDELIDDLVARGRTPDAARREAYARFGHRQVVKERVRDVDVPRWLETLSGDLRYALRALRAAPAFTGVIVLSLALGIGANTAIFTLINAVMLRTLPVRDPGALVELTVADDGARNGQSASVNSTFTNPIWEAIRDGRPGLAGTLAFSNQGYDLSNGGVERPTQGAMVSGSYFNVLGVTPALGRLLLPSDDVRGCPATAVLAHAFWQAEYGGAPSVIGRTISLNGHAFEIIGVAPAGFLGVQVGRAPSVYFPICALDVLQPDRHALDARSNWYLSIMGRLAPGQTLAGTRAALATMARGVFEATTPQHWSPSEQERYRQKGLSARPASTGLSQLRGQYRDALYVLLAVVGVVLLVACANVAQLLMARAAAREHEVAVRLAIGAGRGRLVRQMLTESLVLAFAGAAAGLLFARWSSALIVGYLSPGNPVALDLAMDPRVLGYTIAVAVATGLLFGVVPAWRSSRVDPQVAMHGAGRGVVGDSRHRIQRAMVAGQLALSLVLVVAAGLLGGSFRRLLTLDPGFRREGVLLADVNWARLGYPDEREAAIRQELLDRVRAIPGVQRASASLITPISGSGWNDLVAVDGFTPATERDALLWFNGIATDYMATMGTRLVAGRDIAADDRIGSPDVILINQAAVRHFFGGRDPIGRQLRVSTHDSLGAPLTVIGVVEDAKYRRMTEEAPPTAYVPLAQSPTWGPSVTLSIRTNGAPGALIPTVTRALAELDPAIGISFTSLETQVLNSLARPRLLATLSTFFGGLALLLAVIGLYGAIAYGVARRRPEIGVRLALGATRRGVIRMVIGEAGTVVLIGVVAGGILALAAGRVLAAFLYGVAPNDAATLALAAVTLAFVALLAGAFPAWRASTVDPMEALRRD